MARFARRMRKISRTAVVMGRTISLPGAGLGVTGAALGTALSEVVTAVLMTCFLCFRSPVLRLVKGVPWRLERKCLHTAAHLALLMAAESLLASRFGLPGVWAAMCGELCVRGILFLVWPAKGKWLNEKTAISGEKAEQK